jgi:hypothetical protein
MDVPDQGVKDIPATSVLYNHPAFRMEAEGLRATFYGDLKSDAIDGTWEQAGRQFPLKLTRVTNVAKPKETPLEFKPKNQKEIVGYWKADLNIAPPPQAGKEAKGIQLRLGLNVGRDASGDIKATLDSIDQGVRGIPVTSVKQDKDAVTFELTALQASFTGKMNDAGKQVNGEWTQMGRKLPATFIRVDRPIAQEAGAMNYSATGNEPVGYWLGTLAIGDTSLRLQFKIGKNADGSFAAVVDSLDQGGRNIPASVTTIKGQEVELEFAGMGASYKGQVDAEGKELRGTFKQMGRSNELILVRQEKPLER